MDGLVVNVDLKDKNVQAMIKEAVREIVRERVIEEIKTTDLDSVVKANVDAMSGSEVKKLLKRAVDDISRDIRYQVDDGVKKEIKKAVLAKVDNQPISGNIYLQVSALRTDYDESIIRINHEFAVKFKGKNQMIVDKVGDINQQNL